MTVEPTPFVAPPAGEYDLRIAGLRAWLADHGAHAFVAVSPESVYYLTGLDHLGYFAFTAVLIPAGGAEPVVVTRAMERATVCAQLPGYRHVTFADGTDPATALADALAALVPAGGRLAVEEDAMFFPPSIRARLDHALAGRGWVDGSGVLSALRAVKTPAELDHMRHAAAVSDAAMAAAITAARPGVPERDVAAAVHHTMFAAGGQQPGFTPLIRPLWMLDQEHVSWGDRILADGGLFVELSGCVRRYHAPLSRTVYLGPVPPDAVEAHAAAAAGLHAALDALRPGTTTGEVYAAWRRAVAGSRTASWPSRHHCGYLVGIGFPPSWVGGGEVLGIRPDGEVEIAAGMTFHLMSWVTEPAGHVISDTALVTATGATLLTTTTRELIRCG